MVTTSLTACARRVCLCLLATVLAGTPSLPARAAPNGTPSGAPAAPTPAGSADAFDRGTPRDAMRGFLEACATGDFARASNYLDLRRIPATQRDTQGPTLARQLSFVLDRKLWVDLEQLSEVPEGEPGDTPSPRRDLVGTIQTSSGPVQVLLDHVPREDGTLVWKISAATVVKIPALFAEFGYGPLERLLPKPFFDVRVLQIQLWQWIGLLVLVVIAWGASWVATTIVVRAGRTLVLRSRTQFDDKLLRAAIGPLRLTIGVLLFAAGTLALALAVPVHGLVNRVTEVLTIVAVTWLLLRLVDVLAEVLGEHLASRRGGVAIGLVPLGRRTVKVFIAVLALLAALQNIGVNVTSLLAGLGIGGLAVALAAQKTVEQLFGGVMIIADQPVRVGDFCRYGDKLGTVEDIGLRSTRIRSLDRTVVAVPNGEFAAMQIENFSRRDRIWLHPTVGLRYETTPDQVRYVLIELKKMLLAHPKVDPDPARVRFVNFNAYSLDLEIFAYVLTADYDQYLAIQEDIFLRIMDIVAASGTGFAFPSQTIYAGTDEGVDDAKRRAAEAQVQAWRAAHALCLPNVPASQASALRATLDYPPQGSVSA